MTPTVLSSPPGAGDVQRIAGVVNTARAARSFWGERSIRDRLRVVRAFRRRLVERTDAFVDAVRATWSRPPAETIAAEVLPLAEACRYLERRARSVLRPRRHGRRGRPFWLAGVDSTITHEPHGVVLVVGPSNYPLQLPGIQCMQALVAGNAVLLKPGRSSTPVAELFSSTLEAAGLPRGVLTVLPESEDLVAGVLAAGVDKLVLTGSFETGRSVLRSAAEHVVPATVELSGCDAAFVLPSADLDLVAKSLAYGLQLNDGRTCIAPRRVFVPRDLHGALVDRLRHVMEASPDRPVSDADTRRSAERVIADAVEQGASVVCGGVDAVRPTVLSDVAPRCLAMTTDHFAPILSLVSVTDSDESIGLDGECPFGLGASIFGEAGEAMRLAERIDVGCVTINDLIVPTADPRIPFGGRRASGFGVTRGAEGLLEMTRPKVIVNRRGSRRRHLEPAGRNAATMSALLSALHGDWRTRLSGWWNLIRSSRQVNEGGDDR